MSALHKAEITEIFARWLERYAPPASIRENARAQQDEVEALLGVLLRFSPGSEAGPWVRRVLDRLEYQMKTRAWPTKAEIGSVCSNIRKEELRDAPRRDSPDLSAATVAAGRMARGEPVGEGWLYGRASVELIVSGQVDRQTMERYRSAAFLERKAMYGEDGARAWEDAAKARHEAAKRVHHQRSDAPQKRPADVPDKRVTPPEGWAA
ncbi:hypothetical protein [Pseudodonghicola flavimaris]|uniref:Uncharacterized protein n=1 Tax=Pseudodonghicola flavimaris TaxID=3050036 RepID=A0ABT7EW20_9RHOB|nr:hypothetical protein [Pseudodonghicola flavimaris]MDK3016532.1 hypothetical protein [Pseudodonghicola flavimaris]